MADATSLPDSAPSADGTPESSRRMTRGLMALWVGLIFIVGLSFAALLYFGGEVYQMAPPLPSAVTTTEGDAVIGGDQILQGQDVWRSIGGHELGSVWGHGAYTAPDRTADWLHGEAVWLIEDWAQREYGQGYESLEPEQAAALQALLQQEMSSNTYDTHTGVITV